MAVPAQEDVVPSDIECETLLWDLSFHPNSDILALGCIDGHIQVHRYAVDETEQLFNIKHHKDGVRALDFSPDGQALYSISSDGSLKAIDCASRSVVFDKRDTGHPDALNALHFLNEQLFVTGCDGGVVQLWDRRQHNPGMRWEDLLGIGVHCFTKHTPKGHIITGADDGSIAIFGLRKAEAEVLTAKNEDAVTSMSLINNDGHLATGCASGHIRIWKYGVWDKCCDNLKGHPREVEGMMQLKDGDVMTACCDGCVRAVRLHPQPKLLDTLGNIDDAASMRLARSRCGSLAACAGDNTVLFFDIRRYVAGGAEEHPHGGSFLQEAGDTEAKIEEDEDEDEEDEDSDMEEDGEDDSKKHKKGRHRVDMKQQATKQQQERFFKGL